MQLVETVIKEQYGGSVTNASKITGQHTTNFYRWIKVKAMVDSKGQVYVPTAMFSGSCK